MVEAAGIEPGADVGNLAIRKGFRTRTAWRQRGVYSVSIRAEKEIQASRPLIE